MNKDIISLITVTLVMIVVLSRNNLIMCKEKEKLFFLMFVYVARLKPLTELVMLERKAGAVNASQGGWFLNTTL